MDVTISDQILNYLNIVDDAVEKISNLKEGKIKNLPSWVLVHRRIKIGLTQGKMGCALKISPDPNLENDEVLMTTIENEHDFNKLMDPWRIDGLDISRLFLTEPLFMFDFSIVPENPLLPPPDVDKSFVTHGNTKKIIEFFSKSKAIEDALHYWDMASEDVPASGSLIQELKKVFSRFGSLIRFKAFKERRIHRFINEYNKYLLPSFINCYFEVPFQLGNELRKADFVLEREKGLPPIIVELESPIHKVFRKNGEFTAEVNHAKNQIAEWISFIDNDPGKNASGEFNFLIGPKERLVIIGRGLEHKEKLIASKYTDTIIWTYDFLLQESIARWNKEIASTCKMIGLEEIHPFHYQ